MADQVYLIPGGGLYKDTEQGKVSLVPGVGLVKEQSASGGSTISATGVVPAMAGLLTQKKSYHRALEGSI